MALLPWATVDYTTLGSSCILSVDTCSHLCYLPCFIITIYGKVHRENFSSAPVATLLLYLLQLLSVAQFYNIIWSVSLCTDSGDLVRDEHICSWELTTSYATVGMLHGGLMYVCVYVCGIRSGVKMVSCWNLLAFPHRKVGLWHTYRRTQSVIVG